MAGMIKYDQITKYIVDAECLAPLHVGSSVGSKEEVLVHPVDGIPFLQASSLAGAFRDYYRKNYGDEEAVEVFGASREIDGDNDSASRVRFCDGHFIGNITMELRPRVSIDRKSGTCQVNNGSGQKFNMEYVGAGAQISFEMYLYGTEKQEHFETVFAALEDGSIQFGGQKSNGCGYLSIKQIKKKIFNMTDEEGRRSWANEDSLSEKEYQELKPEKIGSASKVKAYELILSGTTESELLVKGIAVDSFGENAPDAENIRNAKGEFIIPASSIKGVIRSQMERIASYRDIDKIIDDTFGIPGTGDTDGKAGNIRFFDAVVGIKEINEKAPIRHRIHIDKFTGGVMDRGLFSEKNVSGKIELRIIVDNKNNPDATCGLLILALRDAAVQMMNFGSGYNTGKGFLKVDSIIIKDSIANNEADISFDSFGGKTDDPDGIIKRCLSSLHKQEEKNGI